MSDRSGWLGVVTLSERAVYALGGLLVLVALALPWLARWRGLVRYEASEAGQAQALRPALIELPGGVFRMGRLGPGGPLQSGPDPEPEKMEPDPVVEVEISVFAMCETEVTQGQWQAVMGANPSDCRYGCAPDLPVQNVSWFDALRYLNELTRRENQAPGEGERLTECYTIDGENVTWTDVCTGYRLPAGAEWEYAARAGTETAYSFGNNAAQLGEYAWYRENSGGQVHAVATKRANPWGLRDVHGNVWEWVWDWLGPSEDARQKDPRGPERGQTRAMRGGSIESVLEALRMTHQRGRSPGSHDRFVGLRCARSVPRVSLNPAVLPSR